jgi:hypothetical protein
MKIKIDSRDFEIFRDSDKNWRVVPHYHEFVKTVLVDKHENYGYYSNILLMFIEDRSFDANSCEKCRITEYCDNNPTDIMHCSPGNGRKNDKVGYWVEIPFASSIPDFLKKAKLETVEQTDLEKELIDQLL